MKIEEGNMTIEDRKDNLIHDKEGNITCGCGNPKLAMTMHIDGDDFYQNNYQCVNCGNVFAVNHKRAKEDIW